MKDTNQKKISLQSQKDVFLHSFVCGAVGSGRAYHPWDNLKQCKCGGSPFMQGKDGGNFEEGAPYRVECLDCKKHTKYGSVSEIKEDWNNDILE